MLQKKYCVLFSSDLLVFMLVRIVWLSVMNMILPDDDYEIMWNHHFPFTWLRQPPLYVGDTVVLFTMCHYSSLYWWQVLKSLWSRMVIVEVSKASLWMPMAQSPALQLTGDIWNTVNIIHIYFLQSVPSLPALGPWAPPTERGPSLESIYRVSLTVDLCER